MIKKLFVIILSITAFPSASAQTQSGKARAFYRDIMEMRVQIYRISRDKLYEMNHPGFDLIQKDLGDAIMILEEKLSDVESALDVPETKNELQQVIKLWDNLRLNAMRKLDKKRFGKFYYDTKTFDNYLRIIADKWQDKFQLSGEKWKNIRRYYDGMCSLYQMNIGYMVDKHPVNESFMHIYGKSKGRFVKFIDMLKQSTSPTDTETARFLAKAFNQWNFLRYNMANQFMPAEKTVFESTNLLHFFLKRLIPKAG